MDVIVGTAGHIDHGKTSLVKALTGVDADRLPEEKQRGITIDIGFAELDLGEIHIGFVDVPGHERFVKNMLAGASGIDLVILVVAADEGVMPQTREHFEICRLLETKKGIVVITKMDLADAETVELVKLEIAELTRGSFLEGSDVVSVSSRTGEGLPELKGVLKNTAALVGERKSDFVSRLPIDRSFSMKGFGAVVTGTLVSGEIRESQEMELLPSGKKVRVRGVQTHGKAVDVVRSGQRVAVNLGGINHDEVARGMMLTEIGALRSTQVIDTRIEVLSDAKHALRSRQRVRVHIGTVEALARVDVLNETGNVEPGRKDFVQLRLESGIATVPHEHFIIRQYSPQLTIGGGKVLDSLAAKHKKKNLGEVRKHLEGLLSDEPQIRIRIILTVAGEVGIEFSELVNRTGLNPFALESYLRHEVAEGRAVRAENFFIGAECFNRLKEKMLKALEDFHSREPLAKGMAIATLREKIFVGTTPPVFKSVLEELSNQRNVEVAGDVIKATSKKTELSSSESDLKSFFSDRFKSAGLEVPKFDDLLSQGIAFSKLRPEHVRKIFQLLLDSKEVVKVSDDFYFQREVLQGLVESLREFASTSSDNSIDVAKFKEIAGVSRKYAIPLLEYFDREKITQRAGDRRVVI